MNMNRVFHARLTIGTKRESLGVASLGTILSRARATLDIRRVDPKDIIILMEMSSSPLPEGTAFSRESQIEQSLASMMITDDDADSPFPGIKIGEVKRIMATPEYEAYQCICDPHRRTGLSRLELDTISDDYAKVAGDAFTYFPLWLD